MERKYIPEIGKRVKLEHFADYAAAGLAMNWSWLKVIGHGNGVVHLELLDGDKPTGREVTVPLHTISKPVGWQPRYTITVTPDKVDTVLSWFKRGIVCRLSHDLNPHYMPMVFQPLDNSGQPDWRFPEVTDSVPPEECDKVFRVKKIEEEIVDTQIRGLDRKARAALIEQWAQAGWETEYKRRGQYWKRTRETIIKDWTK